MESVHETVCGLEFPLGDIDVFWTQEEPFSNEMKLTQLVMVNPVSLEVQDVPEIQPYVVGCKCPYDCKRLSTRDVVLLREHFQQLAFNDRRQFLRGWVSAVPVKRHRKESSKRQVTRMYSCKAGGNRIQVCRHTFLDVFQIGRKTLECALSNT